MEKGNEKPKIIEAALFLSGRGLRLKEICNAAGTTPAETRKLLEFIMKDFGANSALEIVFDGETYKMKVRDAYLHHVQAMSSLTDIQEGDSKTLSVIAYYQPIRQSDLVKIRGNRAYDQIKRLLGRGLVSAEPKGKTKLLSVTSKFKDYFGNQIDEFRKQIEGPASSEEAPPSGEQAPAGGEANVGRGEDNARPE